MRSLTLLSGGMDSSVALALEVEARRAAVALAVHYGSRHNDREIESARRVSSYLKVPLVIEAMPRLKGSLITTERDVPYSALSGSETVVFGRNLILASVAAHHSRLSRCGWMVLGCNQNDHDTYPDCRGSVWDAFNEALFASAAGVRVHLPFRGRSKQWIAAEATRLGFPLSLTYSCYAGREDPCGVCGACIERNAALMLSGAG